MPRRVPAPTREDVPAEHRAAYDEVAAPFGGAFGSGPTSVLANSPEMALRANNLAEYLRKESDLPQKIRELAMLIAARTMDDDIVQAEKQRRLKGLETLQEGILTDINSAYFDETVEVLAENRKRGSWTGRTRGNKLVYFDSYGTGHQETEPDLTGKLIDVRINRTGPWSLAGVTA